MLLLGGFLSYGSTAIIIVLSVLAISMRSHWRVAVGLTIAAILGFNLFLSYFQHRDELRAAVWGGAPLDERIDVAMDILRDFEWFDSTNQAHLSALDQRLDQNYFAGLAAARIDAGEVDYLYGRSLWEGLMAFVPRLVWPDKPVFGGSPKIVSGMTRLTLSEGTSFGVGNVMEFQINYGMPGVVVGFLVLGWLLGTLDRKAAVAEGSGDLGRVLLFFLPAVALIRPQRLSGGNHRRSSGRMGGSLWLEVGLGTPGQAVRAPGHAASEVGSQIIMNLHLWSPGFTDFGGGVTAFSRELALGLQELGHDLRLMGKVDRPGFGTDGHCGEPVAIRDDCKVRPLLRRRWPPVRGIGRIM